MADPLFVEYVEFKEAGVTSTTDAVRDLDRQMENSRRQAEALSDALSGKYGGGYAKSLVELDTLTRKKRDHVAQLLAEARATERGAAARSGDYLRSYRDEVVLKERLARAALLERSQRLATDREAFGRGDPVSRARAELRTTLGEGRLAADRERAKLAARLQLSQADELKLARDAYALERMRQQVAERQAAADKAARPAERAMPADMAARQQVWEDRARRLKELAGERLQLEARSRLTNRQIAEELESQARVEQMRAREERRTAAVREKLFPTAKELPVAERVIPKAIAFAERADETARRRVSAAAEEARHAASRAGYERQARLEQLRGGGGAREAQERLRAEREVAAIRRQERSNDLTARFGRAGGAIAGSLESPLAGVAGTGMTAAGGLGLRFARRGYQGTVESARMEYQEQRLARNIGGGFKPVSDAYTYGLEAANRTLEKQSAQGQRQLTTGIAGASAGGAAITGNTLSRWLTGRSLLSRLPTFGGPAVAAAGGAGEVTTASKLAGLSRFAKFGRAAGPIGAVVSAGGDAYTTYSEANAGGGKMSDWMRALGRRSLDSAEVLSNSGGYVGRQLGLSREGTFNNKSFADRLLPLPEETSAPAERRQTLSVANYGYEELGSAYDRVTTSPGLTDRGQRADVPEWAKTVIDKLEVIASNTKQPTAPPIVTEKGRTR